MKAIATQKFIRMSPRKLMVIAKLAKSMKPEYAAQMLPYTDRRAALPIQKTIKTAIANAQVKGMQVQDLTFEEIQIGQGPRLKRFRAGSRGMAKPYTHDMAHIRVVLTDEKSKARNTKTETNKRVNKLKNDIKKTTKSGKEAKS